MCCAVRVSVSRHSLSVSRLWVSCYVCCVLWPRQPTATEQPIRQIVKAMGHYTQHCISVVSNERADLLCCDSSTNAADPNELQLQQHPLNWTENMSCLRGLHSSVLRGCFSNESHTCSNYDLKFFFFVMSSERSVVVHGLYSQNGRVFTSNM